jgi:hypothetical protein
MKQTTAKTQLIVMCVLAAAGFCGQGAQKPPQLMIEAAQEKVGKYEKLELLIRLDTHVDNPFDPDQIDLTVLLTAPSGQHITLPAFYTQDYERRQFSQGRSGRNWYYPVGPGVWKARFAPAETGRYSATALCRGHLARDSRAGRPRHEAGDVQSASVQFECVSSDKKGFLRVSRKDPRFLEFDNGTEFFAIGQNLAFIGEGQYINLTKAEQIFGELHDNGANFLRIWTCCQDWAMAIEARKSAWDRSWSRNAGIVPMPPAAPTRVGRRGGGGDANGSTGRKCVKIEGNAGASITVSPSHAVALRPSTRYVLTGRFTAEGPTGLRVGVGGENWEFPFNGAAGKTWQEFREEFVAGENEFWLGRTALSLAGAGTIWLDNLSLKEAPDGPELLWEADVNRPVRGVYNQLDCFILDQLVEAAEPNGIYLMLCVLTRDLYMKDLADDKSPAYEQAIKDARKFMRYAVARWGYSTSVAVWEYFNEINPGLPTDRFYAEVGEYLGEIDCYRHLRATSTWSPSARDCRLPSLDIGQLHHYMRPETKEDFKDEVAVVLEKTRFLREHAPNKPALIGEFGLATPKWGLSENMKQDEAGVHFHNSLWASAFAGASGTAMFWWWDQLDRQNAYGHYRPLARFLAPRLHGGELAPAEAGVSFAGLHELKATASDQRLRLLGYQAENCAYLWVSDKDATWWNRVVDKKQPTSVESATIEIQGLAPGNYRLEWWDTSTGNIIQTEQISGSQGSLHITIPSFSGDIACKIQIAGP